MDYYFTVSEQKKEVVGEARDMRPIMGYSISRYTTARQLHMNHLWPSYKMPDCEAWIGATSRPAKFVFIDNWKLSRSVEPCDQDNGAIMHVDCHFGMTKGMMRVAYSILWCEHSRGGVQFLPHSGRE